MTPWKPEWLAECRAQWKRFHADRIPLGHLLRLSGQEMWLRFHSLPGSVRYAGNDAEREIARLRAETLAGEVLGENQACWLMQAFLVWPGDETRLGGHAQSEIRRNRLRFAWQCAYDAPFEGKQDWHIYAAPVVWHSRAFTGLLDDTAEDRSRALWMNRQTGAIFAPYDGGTDLFLARPDDWSRLREVYPAWLPQNASGL
jgi:hypothetical protein